MKEMNRKRLNNKGFTLIELLAVVVILAIIMGITGSLVLSAMNNTRTSILHSNAKNGAKTLNEWFSADKLILDDKDKKLGSGFENATQASDKINTWVCLDTKIRNSDGKDTDPAVTLASALSLSTSDFKITGTAPGITNGKTATVDEKATCSAVRYNTRIGGYELLLVATTTGKYYNSDEAGSNYAFSSADASGNPIAD